MNTSNSENNRVLRVEILDAVFIVFLTAVVLYIPVTSLIRVYVSDPQQAKRVMGLLTLIVPVLCLAIWVIVRLLWITDILSDVIAEYITTVTFGFMFLGGVGTSFIPYFTERKSLTMLLMASLWTRTVFVDIINRRFDTYFAATERLIGEKARNTTAGHLLRTGLELLVYTTALTGILLST